MSDTQIIRHPSIVAFQAHMQCRHFAEDDSLLTLAMLVIGYGGATHTSI